MSDPTRQTETTLSASRKRAATATSRTSGTLPAVGRARTAVVIDDHPCLLDVIVEMLQHQGWSVRGFSSVEDALRYVRAALPDVVLTDINVGVLSGAALARELRLDPATANLAIVAMTGSVRPTEKMASLFDEVLLKPIELARLSDTLRVAIARREI